MIGLLAAAVGVLAFLLSWIPLIGIGLGSVLGWVAVIGGGIALFRPHGKLWGLLGIALGLTTLVLKSTPIVRWL